MTWKVANHKGADQPAHPRSLISAFLFTYLKVSYPDLLQGTFHFNSLASLCSCVDCFEPYLYAILDDRFSRDEVQLK